MHMNTWILVLVVRCKLTTSLELRVQRANERAYSPFKMKVTAVAGKHFTSNKHKHTLIELPCLSLCTVNEINVPLYLPIRFVYENYEDENLYCNLQHVFSRTLQLIPINPL
jgi:hypothetical protein